MLSAKTSLILFEKKTENPWVSSTAGLSFSKQAVSFLTVFQVKYADFARAGSSPDHPIVFLGAGGKVGGVRTKLLAEKGLYVRATTRPGNLLVVGSLNPFISHAPTDVTKYATLQTAFAGASGVIFAASASGKKKGCEPIDVDLLGSYYTAKACLEQDGSRLVLVSAGSATRPDSAGFKAINFSIMYVYGDHLMDAKIAGEAPVRDLYSAAGKTGYSIVRPGGLSDQPPVGPSKVHISQGDVYSAEIPGQDVALVTTAALLKGPATDSTTIEVNQVDHLTKSLSRLPDLPPELIHAGASSYEDFLMDS